MSKKYRQQYHYDTPKYVAHVGGAVSKRYRRLPRTEINDTVVLQRFSEDTVILPELVHLKEPPMSMGPEPAMDYVHRAVWGMLNANDACIV